MLGNTLVCDTDNVSPEFIRPNLSRDPWLAAIQPRTQGYGAYCSHGFSAYRSPGYEVENDGETLLARNMKYNRQENVTLGAL